MKMRILDRIPADITVKQAALKFDVPESKIRHWIKTGNLNARKIGKQWLVSVSELKRLKERDLI